MYATGTERTDTRERLTREAIVDAAIELISDEGMEALTMRALAVRCGAAPMSLYRHVRDKEDLMSVVLDRYLSDLELPDADELPWRETVMTVFRSVNRAFVRHPRLSQFVASQRMDTTGAYRGFEVLLRALRRAGLDGAAAVEAFDALMSYAAGFATRKAGPRLREPGPAEHLRHIRELPPEQFAMVRDAAEHLVELRASERDFEIGLELLLDGIEQRVQRGGRS